MNALSQRVTRWWASRLPLTDNLALTHRNVYILPTRAGLMMAMTLLLLLVASINYQLNLGYLLTFLLLGCVVVGMHVCHANLRGLALHLLPPEPAFAGQTAVFDVRLMSTKARTRHAIALCVRDSGQWAWADVPARGSTQVQLGWCAPRRGRHALPMLMAQTHFPLGTFRVWTYWRPATTVLVYPAPETPAPPLPPGEPRPGHARAVAAAPSGEFDGLRAYRRGDPLKTVAWKKAAQQWAGGRDELLARDSPAYQDHELWLDHQRCGGADAERRVARLCAWVLQADRMGLRYGLRLPGQEIAPDQGAAHRKRCLEALATC